MSKLKLGVFTAPLAREYFSSSSVKHTVYHHPGQMVLSNGELALVLCDYTVGILQKSPEALSQVEMNYTLVYPMVKIAEDNIANMTGEPPRYDRFEMMVEMPDYPIQWVDSLEEALALYKPQPEKGVLCESSSVTVQ